MIVRKNDIPLLQAHRGYWQETLVKENTALAFRRAAELGFQMVELDVQISREGTLFLYHDIAIKNVAVYDHSDEELLKLGVEPLSELWHQWPNLPRKLNIELKVPKLSVLKKSVRSLVRELEAAPPDIFYLVSSFHVGALRLLKNEQPDVPRALLIDPSIQLSHKLWSLWVRITAPLWLHVHESQAELFLEKSSVPVCVWTVNDPGRAQDLWDKGVISIITDEIIPVAQKN